MAKLAKGNFEGEELSRLYFKKPDEVLLLLEEWAGSMPIASTVRGYAVTVNRTVVDPDEADRRRHAVASVIARSLRA